MDGLIGEQLAVRGAQGRAGNGVAEADAGRAGAAETVIVVEGVSKTFDVQAVDGDEGGRLLGPGRVAERRQALKDVSFTVSRGRTVGIIGPNGAGKSTLLKVIAGVLEPDAGRVEVSGGMITPILGLGAGFAPKLSGVENVYLKGSVLGMRDREIAAAVDEIREFSGLGDALNRPYGSYSSGMRMRLAFAIAFLHVPDILLVDETIFVGDELFRRRSMARIEEVKDAGATILLVSHAAELMRVFCDEVMVMDEGELLISGPPGETLDAYQRLVYAPPGERDVVRRQIKEEGHARLAFMSALPPAFRASDDEEPTPDGFRRVVDCRPLGGQMTGCRFLAPDGSETKEVPSGGRLTVEMTANFGLPARFVSMRLGLATLRGYELGGLHLSPAGLDDPYVSAGQDVLFRGELRVPLAPGSYQVTGELFGHIGEERQCLQRHSRLMWLRVTGEDATVEGPVSLAP